MKKLFICSLLLASTLIFAQNKKATTEDGKKVILKSDNTWEYVDIEAKKLQIASATASDCNLGPDFVEKKKNERLRKFAAVDNDCNPEDIKFINLSESLGNGIYTLCVKGKIIKYKKMGTVFMKADQDPFKMN
jgi:hypothetical protein